MASFDAINYSLRPSKSIERAIAFEGLQKLSTAIDLTNAIYVGFGSVWFSDFLLAHKTLGIDRLISIEEDDIGYHRARYNSPFRTVEVRKGVSTEVLDELLKTKKFSSDPWVIWLDYDQGLSEQITDDIQLIIEKAPVNSTLIMTFSATPIRYGRKPKSRPEFLKTVLGDVVPDDLTQDQCQGETLSATLAELASDFLTSKVYDSGRPGGFVPAFNLKYTDSAPMVTVGGILPALGATPAVESVINKKDWKGILSDAIQAPHLTIREALALQSKLPSDRKLSRRNVRALGFDLQKEQLDTFQKFYRYFPTFAQLDL